MFPLHSHLKYLPYMNKLFGFCLIISIITFAAGCPTTAENQLPTFPVTGKVTQGGAPVAGATVSFSPVTSGIPAALGRTNEQGVYTLGTYGTNDGAVAGDYKVMVSKSAGGSTSGPAGGHDPTGQNIPTGPPAGHNSRSNSGNGSGSLLPEKYASAASTPLSFVVEKKDNEYNIEL